MRTGACLELRELLASRRVPPEGVEENTHQAAAVKLKGLPGCK
jgi:hypothetical protein